MSSSSTKGNLLPTMWPHHVNIWKSSRFVTLLILSDFYQASYKFFLSFCNVVTNIPKFSKFASPYSFGDHICIKNSKRSNGSTPDAQSLSNDGRQLKCVQRKLDIVGNCIIT